MGHIKQILVFLYYRTFGLLVDIRVVAYKYFFFLFRVNRNKIVFINEDYSCNPKAIAEKLLQTSTKLVMIWLSDYEISAIPSGITLCKKSGILGAFHLSTAKVIVMNSKGDRVRYIKKKSQFLIQTHHGSFPLKYVEAECAEKLPQAYVKNSVKDSQMTDLMLSDSAWTSVFCHKALWYNGEILEGGYPRNDIYFNYTESVKHQIREELALNENNKIVTYAPTFRDNGNFDCYDLDANKILNELKAKTGEDWTLLVRAHPNIYFLSGKTLDFDYSEKVRDVTSYPDAQRLFLITDLLITDYSSIMIDFILMHKPVLLFAIDEEEYVEQRGIRPEYRKLPFPHSKNNLELINNLRALDFENPYSNDFIKWYGSKDDGHASERVVNRIIEEISISK